LPKEEGYARGIEPGLRLIAMCERLRIEEVSIYGYTQDNTRRPSTQTAKFRAACVEFARAFRRAAPRSWSSETRARRYFRRS
jgi:undecaprenyl diphosphate synthase